VLLRCLAKHVDDRPATGEQLADDLAEVLANPRGAGLGGGPVAYISPSDTPTLMAGAAARVRLERRQLVRRVAPVLIVLVAAAAAAVPLFARRPEALPPASLQSVLVAKPQLPITVDSADTVRLISSQDSLNEEMARRQAARFRPQPTVGRLSIAAPEGARLIVNGIGVGGPNWSSDTLSPGTYAIRAVIASLDGCPSSTSDHTVRLRAGASERATLSPRPCGMLEINARNASTGATFTLSREGVVQQRGALPQLNPLVLPVGQYQFNAQRPSCRDFSSTVSVAQAGTRPITFIFDCETAGTAGPP
jgi:hypothetical protein